MPALPSPGKVIRVQFRQTDDADNNVLNRVYFSYTGSVSGADATTIASTLTTAWTTHMAPTMLANQILQVITVTDLATASGVEVATAESVPGTASGGQLGAGVCAVVRGVIARRYRGGHPRVYLTGFPAANLATANSWTTAFQGSLFTAWTATLAALTSGPPSDLGTVAEVNVSFYQGFTPHLYPSGRYRNVPNVRTTPVVDNISSWVVNPKLASQRRRNQQSP